MKDTYARIEASRDFLLNRVTEWPSTAIVMGSGLSSIFEGLDLEHTIPYQDIPYFPESTVTSHSGEIRIYSYQDHRFVVLAGRWHYYEGYTSKELTFPIRVLKSAGIETIVFTNVSGGVNPEYTTGDIVLIKDHINMIPDHPLRGPNDQRLGLRFPDMLKTYDKDIMDTIYNISMKIQIPIKEGVYLALQGPSLETPAEYTMAYRLGADMVGMSTVPEVIVAKHSDMRIAALSIISNVCYPIERITETTMEEVVAVANRSGKKLALILHELILRLQ